MQEQLILTGMGTFNFLLKPNSYGKYSLNFHPKNEADRKAVKACGLRNGLKEDAHGFYYVFRADTPPSVMDDNGNPITDIPGDGTELTVTILVEHFESGKYGKVTRGTLTKVIIHKLVPYVVKAKTTPEQTELPA